MNDHSRRLAPALGLLLLASFSAPANSQDGSDKAPPPPADFMSKAEADPTKPRGVRVHEEGAYNGYTLIAPLNSKTVYLIDMKGEVVHSWATDSAPGACVYLLDDGSLLRCGREDEDPHFRGGGIGGRIQILAPDGTITWHFELADKKRHQHHDVEPLPNGNILVIAWERLSTKEAIAIGRDPEQLGKAGFWPDAVLEIKPTKPAGAEIVWEWHSKDHLVQDTDPGLPNHGSIPDHPELIDINGDHRDRPPLTEKQRREERELEKRMRELGYAGGDDDEDEDEGAGKKAQEKRDKTGDWLHTNAVSYQAEFDLIVLSSPHMNELWVIDHSTTTAQAATHSGGRWGHGGDLLWRWGNPRNYGAAEDSGKSLFYQHDPTWITGDQGRLGLLVFNNGRGRADGDYSSVDELVLPFHAEVGFRRIAGRPFWPERPSWTYEDRDGFYSAFISGAQRLPNGNTLICSGASGRVFEVTRKGRIVWDYYNPNGGEVDPPEHAGKAPPLALFRSTRFGQEHVGVRALLR